MDQSLLNVISHIQQIKQDLYQKHKPELIENPREVLRKAEVAGVTKSDSKDTTEKRSSAYTSLMRQHSKIIYKKDREAQQKATTAVESMDAQQHENQLRTRMSSTINFKSAKEELANPSNLADLQKPWNKLTNSLKIRAMLKFIEQISPNLTADQTNQLRYLLIAGINERHLCKLSEIEYDAEAGQIVTIYRLTFDPETQTFKLATKDAGDLAIGLKSYPNLTSPSPPLVTINKMVALTENQPKIKITLSRQIPK